jgi:DNA-binding CsgD family transcriptional regulator
MEIPVPYLRDIFAMISDFVIIYWDGRILYANQIAESLFGMKLEGRPVGDLVHPHYVDLINFRAVFAAGSATTLGDIQVKYRKAPGDALYLRSRIRLIDLEGRSAVLVVGRNVTPMWRKEDLLVSALKSLLSENEMVFLNHTLRGRSRKEIAMMMKAPEQNIDNYRNRIRKKLDLDIEGYNAFIGDLKIRLFFDPEYLERYSGL